MSYLLGIETSTTNCSVSLSKNGNIIALKEDNESGYSHAEKLHVFIDELLKENQLVPQNLDAIVISKGPGSYTGLRIGVSTAKGLCYALNIPLIAIDTLNSLTHQIIKNEDAYIIPMLDARRMEVYTAVYNTNFTAVEMTQALILDENSYLKYLNEKACWFLGNGVSKFQEICSHPNANFLPNAIPSAKELAQIGYQKFTKEQFEDVAYFEPYYLKDFVVGGKK